MKKKTTICLTASEVLGFLDGTRTQIRRIVKPQPGPFAGGVHPRSIAKHPAPYIDAYCGAKKTEANPRGMSDIWCWWCEDDRMGREVGKCPFGAPGGVIVCKETWTEMVGHHRNPFDGNYAYRANQLDLRSEEIRQEYIKCGYPYQWRSATSMPLKASRLSLTPTAIRVERVRDVSDHDAATMGSWERNDWVWVADCNVVGK